MSVIIFWIIKLVWSSKCFEVQSTFKWEFHHMVTRIPNGEFSRFFNQSENKDSLWLEKKVEIRNLKFVQSRGEGHTIWNIIFSGQGPDGGDQWVVINPAKILFSAFINNVCSIKSGSASPAEKFQSEWRITLNLFL